jgi:transcriptional regulator with XRE-family HTH domain
MDLRTKLLQLMQERGWSVNALAQKSGLSFPTVRSYLSTKPSGKRLPSVANLLKLAKALEVNLEDLAGCDDFVKD